jgi:myo-inositol 2-dehydrogenase/D-chiro-inositol 1-dehydrogenase
MIKVGIVGLGRQGILHLNNCLKIDDVKVVAAVDPSKKALQRAKEAGVKGLYTDLQELLKSSSKVDAVVISLPNFLHFESVKSALEEGLNVFIEKPLATTVEECREIVNLTEKSGRKLMVGHVMRFVDAMQRMKETIDKGSIGNLEVCTIEEVINGPFAHPRVPIPVSEWWFDPQKSGGGALLDVGYHMIDLFRYFAGDAQVTFSHLDYKFNLPVEDGAIVILRSRDSSTKGIVNIGWYQKTNFPKYNFRVITHGNAGFLSSDDFVPKNLYSHAVKEGSKNILRRIIGKKIHPLSYTYYYESFYTELVHFFDCIKNDSNPLVSATDGLRTVELVHDAYAKFQRDKVSVS